MSRSQLIAKKAGSSHLIRQSMKFLFQIQAYPLTVRKSGIPEPEKVIKEGNLSIFGSNPSTLDILLLLLEYGSPFILLWNYYSFGEPNVCFTWLQTTEQRAIMSSAGPQIHFQTHGSQSNASKHDQFSRHATLYIYLVLQDDERTLRVVKSQLCSCFWWAVVIRSFQDKFNFRNEFQHGNFW